MKFKRSFCISKTDMNLFETLTCGQIFSYEEVVGGFRVLSGNKCALVTEREKDYLVETDDEMFFREFFDLETDYLKIKTVLGQHEVMKAPIACGAGIRILRQNLLETIVSFAISANNNIGRIRKTVFYLREHFGEWTGSFFAFPTLKRLIRLTEDDFKNAGAGYRSAQLVKLVRQLDVEDVETWRELETEELKEKLITLSGVGPKVADCILLFGYGRVDVFPVDTWIEKVYNQYFEPCNDRRKIRRKLVDKFKNLSGYAQQYLFFYQRSKNI